MESTLISRQRSRRRCHYLWHVLTTRLNPPCISCRLWIEWSGRVVPHCFYNPQTFCPALPEQDPITNSQELRSLHKSKGNCCPVSGPNISAVYIDDGTSLRHRSDVQHGLVLGLDRGSMAENQDFSNKFPVYDWRLFVVLEQHHHALANILATDFLQGKRRALTSSSSWDCYSLAFNGPNCGRGELAQGVRANENGIAGVNHARFHYTADNRTNKGNGECVVNVEFERGFRIVMTVMGQDIEERSDEVEGLACHVGDLKDRTDALTNELCLE